MVKPIYARNIVLGIGTGRCGTQSLATLLNSQKNSYVTHERFRWNLGWQDSEAQVDAFFNGKVFREHQNSKLYGDVAFPWLPYIDLVMQFNPQTKIVCIQRNKSDTVNSWSNKAPQFNYWQKHDGTEFKFGHWSRCFPRFDSCFTRQQAIELYWEYYYAKAKQYEQRYSDRFKIFSTESLNSADLQSNLLSFVGIPIQRQVYDIRIRKNRGI